MASSFDEGSRHDETYGQVMSLYYALKDAGQFVVKRAEMKQGEVAATAIDFCADVEIKAHRELARFPFELSLWELVERDPSYYTKIPLDIRETLGRAFDRGNLGVDGAYRTLYFKTKQQQERA